MRLIARALLPLIIALAPIAAAAQNEEPRAQKTTVEVRYDATLAGQRIERGTYQVEFLDGAEPVVVLSKNRKEVARVRVDKRELGFEAPYDQVSYNRSEDGAREVVAITFKKQREALIVSGLAQVANTVEP